MLAYCRQKNQMVCHTYVYDFKPNFFVHRGATILSLSHINYLDKSIQIGFMSILPLTILISNAEHLLLGFL